MNPEEFEPGMGESDLSPESEPGPDIEVETKPKKIEETIISPEYRHVHNITEEVIREHPGYSHRDRRKEIIRRLEDVPLPPGDSIEKMEDRIKNRFIRELRIGEPGSSSCINAPHAEAPTPAEIARNFHEIPQLKAILPEYVKTSTRMEIVRYVRGKIEGVLQTLDLNNIDPGLLPDNWQGNFSDPVDIAIVDNLKTFEINTSEIARKAAERAGTSSFQWRMSRIKRDPNARSGEYYHVDKEKGKESLEYPSESQYAGDLALEEVMKQTSEIGEDGKVQTLFIDLQLHRQFDKPERTAIIIADGIKKGKTPCHPAIARWFAETLQEKVNQAGLKYADGRPLDVSVAHEGMSLCGGLENIRRRFGGGVHEGFGELYQCLQTEIKASILKEYSDDLAEILGEIMREINEKLPDKESYENFINTEATEEEKNAENGIARPSPKNEVLPPESETTPESGKYEYRTRPPEDVAPGTIACNGPCRRKLGVEPNQPVWVMGINGDWIELRVTKAKTSFAGNDKPSLCNDMKDKVNKELLEIRITPPQQ